MNNFVLDSSFVLAILFREPLSVDSFGFLDGSTICAVNFAEVWTKLQHARLTESEEVNAVLKLLGAVEPFTEKQARMAGLLHNSTKAAGLSLGDRACLALALELDAEAVTTDRAWAKVDVGCSIRIVR